MLQVVVFFNFTWHDCAVWLDVTRLTKPYRSEAGDVVGSVYFIERESSKQLTTQRIGRTPSLSLLSQTDVCKAQSTPRRRSCIITSWHIFRTCSSHPCHGAMEAKAGSASKSTGGKSFPIKNIYWKLEVWVLQQKSNQNIPCQCPVYLCDCVLIKCN